MKEIWRDIVGYEGLYQVSNTGKVKSLRYRKKYEQKEIAINLRKDGYLQVNLNKQGHQKIYLVHRLVAQTFLPNPENKPYINHIDCNPSNNCVNNLEWCTQSENMQYAVKLGRIKSSSIIAINLKTGEEKFYINACEAGKDLKITRQAIYGVLNNQYKQMKGYTFRYAE